MLLYRESKSKPWELSTIIDAGSLKKTMALGFKDLFWTLKQQRETLGKTKAEAFLVREDDYDNGRMRRIRLPNDYTPPAAKSSTQGHEISPAPVAPLPSPPEAAALEPQCLAEAKRSVVVDEIDFL